MRARMTDPDHSSEIFPAMEARKSNVWNIGDSLGHPLVLLCPEIKVNGKLQQPNPTRTNGPDPTEMRLIVPY